MFTCTRESQHVPGALRSQAFRAGEHWKNSEKPHIHKTRFKLIIMNQSAARCHATRAKGSSVTAKEDLLMARAIIPKNRPVYRSRKATIRLADGISARRRPIPLVTAAAVNPQ